MQHVSAFHYHHAFSVRLRPFRLLLPLLSAHRFSVRFSIFYPTFCFCPVPVYLDIVTHGLIAPCNVRCVIDKDKG